jgi:hypothetical protein
MNNFDNMNIDPKNPSEAIPSYMLTNALRYIPDNLLITSGPQVSMWMQYWTEIPYVDDEEYNMSTSQDFPFYQTVLVNLQSIINQNSDTVNQASLASYGDNNNQIAIARILKAYYFLGITDTWGDIPYFKALQGVKNITPSIDTQKSIYYDLFKELTEAVSQINDNPINPIKGDFLFNGDMMKWKKFANTTRLIMAMRISNVDPAKGDSEFNAAVNASGGIIESNADNIEYPFLNSTEDVNGNNYNYLYNWNNSSNYEYALCKTLVDYMNKYNDPRLPYYADKALATNTYVGQPVATIGQANQFSQMGVNMRQQNTPMYIYSYAQVLFTLSEAAVRGWISGNAQTYYNEAIQASMQQYNVYDPTSFSTYINQPDIQFNPNNPYESIGYQKWVALYPYGNEEWAEWRRLGYPQLTPAPGALTIDGQIPRRETYGIDIKRLMPTQFAQDALVQLDLTSTHIWWDVKNP